MGHTRFSFSLGLFLVSFAFVPELRAASPSLRSGRSAQSVRWDLAAETSLSVPPALVAQVWGGWSVQYRLLDWNALDWINKRVDRLAFGYLRPNIRFLSAARVNQADFRLDVYPFTFAGFTAGVVLIQQNLGGFEAFERATGYDCDVLDCDRFSAFPFFETTIKWAASETIGGEVLVRWDWVSTPSDAAQIHDPASGLPYRTGHDRGFEARFIAAKRLTENDSVGLQYRSYGWNFSKTGRNDYAAFYHRSPEGPWSFLVELRRTHREDRFRYTALTGGLRYEWRASPSPL